MTVEPAPPTAAVPLPWDGPVADPVAALAGARAQHGDTFRDASGRYLFLFSPEGVRSFYGCPRNGPARVWPTSRCCGARCPTSCSRDGAPSP